MGSEMIYYATDELKYEYQLAKYQAKQDLIFFADRCSVTEYVSYLLNKEKARENES